MRRSRLACAALLTAGGCGMVVESALLYQDHRRRDGDPGAPPATPTSGLPSVAIVTPSGTQSDRVPLAYVLTDAQGDPADLTAEYAFSTDAGLTWSAWAPATERPGPPSDGTVGVASAPAGAPHTFVWNAFADVGGSNGLARVRLTAVAPGPPPVAGGSGTTAAFALDDRLVATVVAGASGLLAFPGGVARDAAGHLYIADTLNHRVHVCNTQTGSVTIANVTIAAGQMQVIAGTGTAGFNGDNQAATGAQLNFPAGLVVDAGGHVLVADALNHRLRRIDGGTGFITTFAGTGTAGRTGDGGLATGAQLNAPRGLGLDGSGNVWVADTGNHWVRVLNTQSTAITVAGVTVQPNSLARIGGDANGKPGNNGDGGAVTNCKYRDPWGVAVAGVTVHVADAGNHAIRVINTGSGATSVAGVTIQGGRINTVVGTNGTSGFTGDGSAARNARCNTPRGVALDASGNIHVADTGNDRLRCVNVTAGTLTRAGVSIPVDAIATIGGGGASPGPNDGDAAAATAARCSAPEGAVVLAGSHVALADTGLGRVRVVNTGTGSITLAGVTIAAGDIDTVAGTVASATPLLRPAGVARLGTLLFVADVDAHRVRQVDLATGLVTVVAGTGAAGFAGDGGTAASAVLSAPRGLALDTAGNLYLADWGNGRIRVINRQATAQTLLGVSVGAGQIATVAGGGAGGDGGPATGADLTDAPDCTVDASGNLWIAHAGAHAIRRVAASTGTIATLVGALGTPGFADGAATTTARLTGPAGIRLDAAGNPCIADTQDHAVRYANLGGASVTVCGVTIAAGDVATVAGIPPATGPVQGWNGDNQAGTSTQLDSPTVAFRIAGGHLLWVDAGNQRVRRVDQATGLVSTVAGTGTPGWNGDGLPAVNTHWNAPSHAWLDGATPANLFLADAGNRRVRRLVP